MVTSDNNKSGHDDARKRLAKRQKGRLRRHIRGYFLAGVLVTAPMGITFYISWLLIRWVDAQVTPLLPPAYNPETYLPFAIPGLGMHFVDAVLGKDLTMIMGIVLVYSFLLVLLNLTVDVMYAWVDPRITLRHDG